MHTVLVIFGGFLLLGLCLLLGRWTDLGIAKAAPAFLTIWLVVAAINMWVGVNKAGYAFGDELPIFLVIFSIPAIVTAVIWWKFSNN
jgi:hypothetical protein